MSSNDLSNLQNLIDDLQPFLTRAEKTQQVRQMRNEVQADWLSNFMNTMESKLGEEDTTASIENPTLNKQTGMIHTVESMVQEISSRVGLDILSKKASVHDVGATSAILKLKSIKTAGLESLNRGEQEDLMALLKSIRPNKKEAAPILSIKQMDGEANRALVKLKNDNKNISSLAELDKLSNKEIDALIYKLNRIANVNDVANKDDVERIASYVEAKMIDTGNYASLEQILSGIMDDKNMQSIATKLGRETIKGYVEKMLLGTTKPDANSLLPQAKPGAPGMRSQISSGPNDPNRFMFTSSNPSARYV